MLFSKRGPRIVGRARRAHLQLRGPGAGIGGAGGLDERGCSIIAENKNRRRRRRCGRCPAVGMVFQFLGDGGALFVAKPGLPALTTSSAVGDQVCGTFAQFCLRKELVAFVGWARTGFERLRLRHSSARAEGSERRPGCKFLRLVTVHTACGQALCQSVRGDALSEIISVRHERLPDGGGEPLQI